MNIETYYHPKNDGHAYRCALNTMNDYFEFKSDGSEIEAPAIALHLETVDGHNVLMTDILPTDRFVIQTLALHRSLENIRFGFRDGLGERHRRTFTQEQFLSILAGQATASEEHEAETVAMLMASLSEEPVWLVKNQNGATTFTVCGNKEELEHLYLLVDLHPEQSTSNLATKQFFINADKIVTEPVTMTRMVETRFTPKSTR